ncbi:MAG TPA: DUF4118 domain-containing protein, partial [Acidimicrobiia bacterium]|nr:DUF4118 domain-containing protein [Acidimicrobiia bacterium]
MRILVAEDDPVVGDAYADALRAGFNTVVRTTGVDDTVGKLQDAEAEVAILDVQLRDGSAWDVLDSIGSPHPPFRVSLVTAMDVAPPQRWSHLPLFRKPLDHKGLLKAVDDAAAYQRSDDEPATSLVRANGVERLLLSDEPRLLISIPVVLAAIALMTLLMIPIREEAFGAISAGYTIVVLAIAAYAGVAIGIAGAAVAFLAYNYFTVPPYYTFDVATTPFVLNLLAFLAAALVGALLIGTGRTLARRHASDAALSRLRLQVLSQTRDVSSSQLIGVITRIVREALSAGTTLALL